MAKKDKSGPPRGWQGEKGTSFVDEWSQGRSEEDVFAGGSGNVDGEKTIGREAVVGEEEKRGSLGHTEGKQRSVAKRN